MGSNRETETAAGRRSTWVGTPFVREFLDVAFARGRLDGSAYLALREDLESFSELRAPQPPRPAPAPPRPDLTSTPADVVTHLESFFEREPLEATTTLPAPVPMQRPDRAFGHPIPIRAAPPMADALARARAFVASDLSLHGLAYLGVLLTFVGTLGFVIFAWGSVRAGLRPVAELLIPTVLLASGRFLRGRGAPVVADALILTGGALLPVVLIASLVDGASPPPDPTGAGLVLAIVAVCLAVAGAYATWCSRNAGSPLRYLVAPSLWLGALAAGLAMRPGPVAGEGIRRISEQQAALLSVAVAASLVAARARPRHPLSRPAQVAAAVGVPAGLLLALLSAGPSGWPSWPALATGLATVASLELVGRAFRRTALAAATQPLAFGACLLPSIGGPGPAWTATIGAAASVLFVERLAATRARRSVRIVTAAIGGLWLWASLLDAHAAMVAFAGVAVWAHVRRLRPTAGIPRSAVAAVASLAPLGFAIGVLGSAPAGYAWVALAAGVLAGAVAARRFAPGDPFHARWFPFASSVLLAAIAMAPTAVSPTANLWPLAAAAWLAASCWAAGPGSRLARVVGATAGAALAIWLTAAAAGLGHEARISTLALAAASTVAVATAFRGTRAAWSRTLATDLAWAGHAILVATALAPFAGTSFDPSTRIFVSAAWVGAWGITAVADETGRSALRLRAPWIPRWLPAAILGSSLAGFCLAIADARGAIDGRPSSAVAVLVAVAICESVVARALAARPMGRVLATTALGLTAISLVEAAATRTHTGGTARAVALAAAGAVAASMAAGRARPAWAAWYGWATAAAAAGALAIVLGVAPRGLPFVLLAFGAASAIGALASGLVRVDRPEMMGRPWAASARRDRRRWLEVRDPRAVPPLMTGIASIVVSAAIAAVGSFDPSGRLTLGWWCAAAATVAALLAVQAAEPWLLAAACALAVAAPRLVDPGLFAGMPWAWEIAAATILSVAFIAGEVARRRTDRTKWILAPLAVAQGTAVIGLVAGLAMAPDGLHVAAGSAGTTWASAGGLSLAIAAWRRSPGHALAGAVLATAGAQASGTTWGAAALASDAAAAVLAARRAAGSARSALQVSAGLCIAGAALDLAARSRLGTVVGIEVAASISGVALFGGALAVARGRITRDWLLAIVPASAGGLVWSLGTALGRPDSLPGLEGWTVTGSVLLFGAGTALLAPPLEWRGLRFLAAGCAAAAAGLALATARPGPTGTVGALLGLVAACDAAVMRTAHSGRHRVRGGGEAPTPTTWAGPAQSFVALVLAGAVAVAVDAWPARELVVASLLAVAGAAAIASVSLSRRAIAVLTPIALCGAWFVFAGEAFLGDPDWFTIPAGAALLAVSEVLRRDARRSWAALDLAGAVATVAPPLVRALGGRPWAGLVGLSASVALAAWGALTQVRRRAAMGIVGTMLFAFVLIAVPMAGLVPRFRGPALWIALAAAGTLLTVVAATLERIRTKVRSSLRRIGELTRDWS